MEMEYRRLGNSGLRVSALGFGSWVTFNNQVQVEQAMTLMKQAYDAGVNFFDNAEAYAGGKSEEIMGEAMRQLGWSRDSYVVSSKVFWGGQLPTQRGLSRKHVHDACHAALKRLQVDYLDLFYCHRPDHHTPIEETVRAMDVLVQQGKILYWGTSEWSAQEIQQAHTAAQKYNLTPPTMEQPQYNMFHRARVEVEYEPLYRDFGLGTTIWSPLASGILTGKYSQGIPQGSRMTLPGFEWLKEQLESEAGRSKVAKAQELEALAREVNASLATLAIAWCLKNQRVSSVILGATRPEQLQENLKALELAPLLSGEIMGKIDGVLGNKPERPPEF